jgi:hypothetical protein
MHIIFLIDKSSSMTNNIEETIKGYNTFIENQQSLENTEECIVSLYLFSTNIETIYEKRNLNNIIELDRNNYRPNGSTALLDSMGYILEKINIFDKTIFVVITDGQENSSKIYRRDRLRNLIDTKKNNVEIVYMGSNQDAILAGGSIGSNININYDDIQTPNVYRGLSSAVTRLRIGQSPTVIFSQEEINSFRSPDVRHQNFN